MKREPGVLTEEEFEERYRPYVQPSGDYFEYEDVKDRPINTVWSLTEGDGPYCHLYAGPGFHVVNVMGYCLTEVPWTDEETDAYWFFDDRTGYTAVVDYPDGTTEEVDEVGEDEADVRQRIESYEDGIKIVSISLHEEEA
jgi:hypothetical protein